MARKRIVYLVVVTDRFGPLPDRVYRQHPYAEARLLKELESPAVLAGEIYEVEYHK